MGSLVGSTAAWASARQSTKGKAGAKSASRSRASGSGRPRRTWPRSGRAPGRAQGTRLQGRCGSMNWNVAPFAHCSSASERCRASRSAFSRASLCGPRRRRRRPPRDWRANSFARLDLFRQVALLAPSGTGHDDAMRRARLRFVAGRVVGDRPDGHARLRSRPRRAHAKSRRAGASASRRC